jgi:transcriptional regulator with XRE-family HTH domain
MSRYEQRKRQRLKNADVSAGYREADAEFSLLDALDRARASLGVSQAQLAEELGRTQPAVSQFFSGAYAVTIDAVAEYLQALHLQVRIEIVPATEGEPALVVMNPRARHRRSRPRSSSVAS